jgi:copper chaperone CopZ
VDLCDRCFATVEDEIPTLDGTPPDTGTELEASYDDDGDMQVL